MEEVRPLEALLRALVSVGGSDLHLSVGLAPAIRLHGVLHPLPDLAPLAAGDVDRLVLGLLRPDERERFAATGEVDAAIAVPGLARFRVNVFHQREVVGAVLRAIPFRVRPLAELGLPDAVRRFAELPRGLVLVTGPTGSGKSTTLAALVDHINRTRDAHILTIEDPIEFVHGHGRCIVNQREVGRDTASFAAALRAALRQDPDVILVGELRDAETVGAALTAAETGHLVLGTLHTQDAPQTIDRVLDVFPSDQQAQVRSQLALSLQGVVTQLLVPTADGRGRAIAAEVLVATPAVRNLVREAKTHQLASAISVGGAHGMQALDTSLARLVAEGVVTYDAAQAVAADQHELARLCGRAARTA